MYGPSSTEAKLAWETVEEVASSDLSNALGGRLGDDCELEQSEACVALDELNQALQLN